jgi:hypothetical protein
MSIGALVCEGRLCAAHVHAYSAACLSFRGAHPGERDWGRDGLFVQS